MSDVRLRELERAAATGDPQAAEALDRERCRRGDHDPEGGLLFVRCDMRYDMTDPANAHHAQSFQRCRRCRAEIPQECSGLSGHASIGFATAMADQGEPVSVVVPPPPRRAKRKRRKKRRRR